MIQVNHSGFSNLLPDIKACTGGAGFDKIFTGL